jgi:DNA polymerase-3 subunit epsilon
MLIQPHTGRPLDDEVFVVVDIETTGLEPEKGHRIVEVGAIRFTTSQLLRSAQWLVHPQRDIPEEARRVHGISVEMVRDKPPFPEVAVDVAEMLRDAVVVAQHAAFDVGFLDYECARAGVALSCAGVVDTISLVRGYAEVGASNLDALAEWYGIPKPPDRHRSMADCEVTRQVFLAALADLRRYGKVRTVGDLLRAGRPRPKR